MLNVTDVLNAVGPKFAIPTVTVPSAAPAGFEARLIALPNWVTSGPLNAWL
jgi:hypothetical protein